MSTIDFQNLQFSLLASLDGLQQEPIQLPAEYARARRVEQHGSLELCNRFIALKDLGEIRSVHIDSPKIKVITLFFFPDPVRALPLFSLEFVQLGEKPIVAMFDARCLLEQLPCRNAVRQRLRQTHAECPEFRQDPNPPQWYQECRSGEDFFIRPESPRQLIQLGKIALRVWHDIVKLFPKAPSLSANQLHAHAEALRTYKDHHRDHSPGLKLMNRSFGEQWTDGYLRNFLFA